MSTPIEITGHGPDHEFSCEPGAAVTLEVKRRGTAFRDASAQVAEVVTALVKQGATVEAIEAATGQPAEVVLNDNKVKRALKALKAEYALTASDMKELVKARAAQLVVEGDDKVALDAAKFMASFPDVGLTSTSPRVNLNVGVFSEETSKVLASVTEE